MDFKRVAIVGIDAISASIALGLKAQKEPPDIIGYDAEAAVADLARARGTFDQITREPGPACEGADLVIVAEPLSAIPETFAAIAPHLQPGCLVTDILRLKAPVLRWAEEHLPQHVSFVGGHLIPNPAIVGLASSEGEGLDTASAGLLKNGLYCFITPSGVSGTAIDACSALARALGAHPYFIDVTEHDGLQAGVVGLLDLLTIAVLRATVDTPGWQEMRKFAGHRFAAATEAADGAYERQSSVFLNRANVIRRLDVLLKELMYLRGLLISDDAEALEAIFAEATEGRARWIEERKRGMWVEEGTLDTSDALSAGEQLGQMFFGGLLARRRGTSDRSREE